MNNQGIRIAGIALTLSFILQPVLAEAGWGDLIKKIEESAPELLKSAEPSIGNTGSDSSGLDSDTLIRGLKQALEVGTQRAVEGVSKTDGYFANPAIKIPLPGVVNQGASILHKMGMSTLVDDFELSMNRAAEKAAPQATEYFLSTLKQMSIEDAREIYQGADDAATRYFQQHTSSQLETVFKPIITETMEQVGVTRYYKALVQQASKYPLVGDMGLDLENHVTKQALEGLFLMLAEEEKKIRANPVARSTDLLKQLFGY